MKRIVYTPNAPKAVGPYSQAVITENFVYTSGQVALTPEGNLLRVASIADEVHQVMKNLAAILQAGGVDFDAVVRTTIYVTDVSLYSEVNKAYGVYMKEPYPARETVGVKELPLGARVEISMIAEAPMRKSS